MDTERPAASTGTPLNVPSQTDAAALARQVSDLAARLQAAERDILQLRTSLTSARVRIQNFEGIFKLVSTTPSNSDDYQDGSLLFYDDGATTRRIYAKMNKVWRSVNVT